MFFAGFAGMQFALCSQRLSAGSPLGVSTVSCGRKFVHGVHVVGQRQVRTVQPTCAASCLDEDVDMPVVVLDRCPVSTCRILWSPAVRRSGGAVSVWQQRQVRTVQLCSRQLPWLVSLGQLRL